MKLERIEHRRSKANKGTRSVDRESNNRSRFPVTFIDVIVQCVLSRWVKECHQAVEVEMSSG